MRDRVDELLNGAMWARKPRNAEMDRAVVEAIARRRRQILVHSCIYYTLNDNIISDEQWTLWAQQLAKLQKKFGWKIGFYDREFRGFNGSTGHHLPTTDPSIMNVAIRLLRARDAEAHRIELLLGKPKGKKNAKHSATRKR